MSYTASGGQSGGSVGVGYMGGGDDPRRQPGQPTVPAAPTAPPAPAPYLGAPGTPSAQPAQPPVQGPVDPGTSTEPPPRRRSGSAPVVPQPVTGTAPPVAGTAGAWNISSEQEAVAAQAGIPTYRFDPNWWLPGWENGGRRPDKVIWDTWTPEQQAMFGGQDAYKLRGQQWRWDIGQQRDQQYSQLAAIKAANPSISMEDALAQIGVFNRPEEGQSFYREMMLQGQGLMRGSYHLNPETGTKTDVATSDLSVRGKPQPMDAEDWRFVQAMQGGDQWGHVTRLAADGKSSAAGARPVGAGQTPAAAAAAGGAAGGAGGAGVAATGVPGSNPLWTGPGSLQPNIMDRDKRGGGAPSKDPNFRDGEQTLPNVRKPEHPAIRPPVGAAPAPGGGTGFGSVPQTPIPGGTGTGSGIRPGSMSQFSAQQMSALTNLARWFEQNGQGLYGVGNDAWSQAVRYYETMLGKGGRYAAQNAVSPQAQNINDVYRGANAAIGSGYMRGGAKDYAQGELERERARSIANLYTGVQPAAADRLGALGMEGVQQGTSMVGLGAQTRGGLLSADIQNNQFGLQLNQNSKQFDAQLAAQIGMNNAALQMQAQAYAMQERLAQAQMAMQQLQFDKSLSWQQTSFNQALQAQRSQGKGSFWGGLVGVGSQFIPKPGGA